MMNTVQAKLTSAPIVEVTKLAVSPPAPISDPLPQGSNIQISGTVTSRYSSWIDFDLVIFVKKAEEPVFVPLPQFTKHIELAPGVSQKFDFSGHAPDIAGLKLRNSIEPRDITAQIIKDNTVISSKTLSRAFYVGEIDPKDAIGIQEKVNILRPEATPNYGPNNPAPIGSAITITCPFQSWATYPLRVSAKVLVEYGMGRNPIIESHSDQLYILSGGTQKSVFHSTASGYPGPRRIEIRLEINGRQISNIFEDVFFVTDQPAKVKVAPPSDIELDRTRWRLTGKLPTVVSDFKPSEAAFSLATPENVPVEFSRWSAVWSDGPESYGNSWVAVGRHMLISNPRTGKGGVPLVGRLIFYIDQGSPDKNIIYDAGRRSLENGHTYAYNVLTKQLIDIT